MDSVFPINLDRIANVGAIAETALKRGQAVTFGTTALRVKAVADENDFVIGFASEMDYAKNDDCQFFEEGGDCYALNGGTALKRETQFNVAANGTIKKADAFQLALGYVLEDIEPNKMGAVRFRRLPNHFIGQTEVNFASNVVKGQGVKLSAAKNTVSAVSNVGNITIGFAMAAYSNGETGYIDTRLGSRVIALAGANIAKESFVKINANGHIITAATDKDFVLGIALEAITATNLGPIESYRLHLGV